MPCYDSRNDEPLKSQLEEQYAREAYQRGDYEGFYRNVTKGMLEQWLCDALRRNHSPHDHCLMWWELHKRRESKSGT